MKINKLLILFFVLLPIYAYSLNIHLKVNIETEKKGTLNLYLCNDKIKLCKNPISIKKVEVLSQKQLEFDFNVKKGEYNFVAFLDVNHDGKADMLGREPWGVSGKRPHLRMPKWKNIKFEVYKDIDITFDIKDEL